MTDIDNLVDGDAHRGLKYATFEPDKWLLDGTYHFASDPDDLGFVSDVISGIAGTFISDPELTITLAAVVDIEQGLTLEFSRVSGDYCNSVTVEYQDAATASVYSNTYSPDDYTYFCEIASISQPAEDVKYIVITFHTTATVERHVKLLDVYVDGVIFDKTQIRAATLVEEISPISVKLHSNELEFTLYSDDGDFSIVTPSGVYAGLEENQRVDVYEFVDGTRIYMGRFYLKDWDSKSENLAEFYCVDAITLLEESVYSNSGRYIYDSVGDGSLRLVRDVDLFVYFGFLGVTIGYNIAASLGSIDVLGFVDYGANIRETLQEMAFSVGGYVTCSRSKDVEIKETELVADVSSWDFTLTTGNIGVNPNLTLRPVVTGIDMTTHRFPDNNEHVNVQVYNGAVTAGDYFVLMASDYYAGSTLGFVGTTATYSVSWGVKFFDFTVTGAGDLVIQSTDSFAHETTLATKRVSPLPDRENTLVVKDTTFIHPGNVDDLIDRVYDYYQQRYAAEFKTYASLIAPGDSVKMPAHGEELWGIVERIESDLANGFVQKVTVVGTIN